jgi:hypothetical protein
VKTKNEQANITLKKQTTLRTLAFVTVFICGIVLGGVGGAMWMRGRILSFTQNPNKIADRVLARIQAQISLDPTQYDKVAEVVHRNYALMNELRDKSQEKQVLQFHQMKTEVGDLLTNEQRVEWIALCDSVEARYLPLRSN